MEDEIEEVFEESHGVYVYDDYYESLTEDKKKILSQISPNLNEIYELKNENKSKLNKLKLLLYQKFINILFSILGLNLRRGLKIFVEKTKFLKLKNLGYKLENDNKKFKVPEFYMKSLMKQIERKEKKEQIKNHHENNKKGNFKVNVKPSDHEVEYNKYMDKVRLEKLKKEEKKKFELDLIQKENYADNIYKFLIRRKFFRTLMLNLELNQVVHTFMENIHSRIIKKVYLDKMKFISDSIQEKRMKMELIKLRNASEFYYMKLRVKIFKYLQGYYDINNKMKSYFYKTIVIKKKKKIYSKFFKIIKISKIESSKKEKEIIKKINFTQKLNYSKIFLKGLKVDREERNDEKLKNDLINKLKEKANSLIYEKFNY